MKTIKAIIYLTVLLLIISTLATLKLEAASDGLDQYGFPFTFYDSFSGKCDNCYENFGFKPLNFLVDILFVFCLAFVIVMVKIKFYRKKLS
ncbi:hypothetical protein [Pedobacter sp. Bi36]|uniref:hypothetical protein n=1 Tax=Pedobacter sp. Bi36 TaxID=2822352 RepID=UPI001D994779|nr:hypothetical protein [Pedobacter sp. Bi36]CAH0160719.1 hypothetical protein SRABI36_01012 [Pedobacter sp. Bi36]CAH0216582.1 hypothetical protein SRABI126_02103 [Pedobacter sp. Bi126]